MLGGATVMFSKEECASYQNVNWEIRRWLDISPQLHKYKYNMKKYRCEKKKKLIKYTVNVNISKFKLGNKAVIGYISAVAQI